MEVDVVYGGGDIVLNTHLRLICGRQLVLRVPTRTKMTPAVPIIWLAEAANGEDMLENVNILSNLACIQHHRQRPRDQRTRTVMQILQHIMHKLPWYVMIHKI